jgi:hypothetical protein
MHREGEIICRVGRVVIWLEMGGLEGAGGWGGVDRREGRLWGLIGLFGRWVALDEGLGPMETVEIQFPFWLPSRSFEKCLVFQRPKANIKETGGDQGFI